MEIYCLQRVHRDCSSPIINLVLRRHAIVVLAAHVRRPAPPISLRAQVKQAPPPTRPGHTLSEPRQRKDMRTYMNQFFSPTIAAVPTANPPNIWLHPVLPICACPTERPTRS
ncbi:hypothetical protein LTR28_001164, partial [Elasticomyces elasticus]